MAHLKPDEILARAKEYSRCAEFAVQNSMFNGCAICSYAALFWAALAALAYEGFTQPTWDHGELRAKFIHELIEIKPRYPKQLGNWLINSFTMRNTAQYQLVSVKTKEIKRMINHVQEFVQRIEEVLSK